MQLHLARLCLDCQEIHADQTCPICTSETFAYISRWVPTSERRVHARPEPPANNAETYRQLLATTEVPPPPKTSRWVKRGVLVAALSVAGWLWRRAPDTKPGDRTPQ